MHNDPTGEGAFMIRWMRAHADPDECLATKAASA